MRNNNRIVVDLNKIQFANFYYKSGPYSRAKLPKHPTVNNTEILPGEKMLFSTETMLSVAQRRNLLDIWIPTLRLQLSANHSLIYTGKKAISIFREFSRRQFKQPTKNKQ